MSAYLKIKNKAKLTLLKALADRAKIEKPSTFIGENASLQMCKAIPNYGVNKLLLVTDKVLVSLGLHQAIVDTLDEVGIHVTVYDDVSPDPSIQQMEQGIIVAKKAGVEAVLALGGGSPIDTAKVIAAALSNDMAVKDMEGAFNIKQAPLPLFAIPTTSGTGSETTMFAIVSDPERDIKFTIIDPKLVPKMAALDPILTVALPKSVTAATGMDALAHGLEAYLSFTADEAVRERGKLAISGIFKHLPTAYKDPSNKDARAGTSFAAFMGGMAINTGGTGYIHAFAHNLGVLYHVPHGLANAYMMVPVLNLYKDTTGAKLAELAVLIGVGEASESETVLADKFVAAVKQLAEALDIPAKVPELQVSDHATIYDRAQAEAMALMASPRFINRDEGMQLLASIQST